MNVTIRWRSAALLLVALAPTLAQYGPITGATATQSLPGSAYATVSNNYLAIDVRQPGIVQAYTTAGASLGFSNYRGGRAIIRTTGGDPFTATDNGFNITGTPRYSTWSTITLKRTTITGGKPVVTTSNYEVESSSAPADDPSQDLFTSPPTVNGDTVTYTWQVRDLLPTVTNPLADNVTQANAGVVGAASAVVLLVTQSYRLVHNKVRCETLIQNVSPDTVVVGCQTFVSPQFGNFTGTSAAQVNRVYFNTLSQPLATETTFPSTNPLATAAMKTIPNSWRAFDSETSPGMVLGGVLDGADVRTAPLTAGIPDSVLLLNQNVANTTFLTYTTNGGSLTGALGAMLARWQNRTLGPSNGLRFITYYGLAADDNAYDTSYVLSAEAPFSLSLAKGDDPSTALTEGTDNVYRTPNPFTVRAGVYNTTDHALTNVVVSLSLPGGLNLANTATDTINKSIPVIPPRSEQTVSWQVQALKTLTPGILQMTVSSSGASMPSKVVRRQIGIPALPALQFPTTARRLDMISVPYDFANRDVQHVLGTLGNIGVTGGGSAAVARYNPTAQAYSFFPDPAITNVVPGQGMWLYNGALTDLSLPTDQVQLPITTPQTVTLAAGWNQIGCPYTVPVRLFDCQVVTAQGLVLSFSDAVNAGSLRPVIYGYVPNDLNPSSAGTYSFSGDTTSLINPWRGYWLRVLEPITLQFNANALIGPFRGQGRDWLALRGGWEIGLTASQGAAGEREVRLGRDPDAADGYDSRDVEAPPPVRAASDLRLTVVEDGWGRDAGRYLRDVRGTGAGSTRWHLLAECDQPNSEVTLRWNLRGLPSDVSLTLVDLQSGARRALRTSASYSYNTGALAQPRAFDLLATPQSTATLSIGYMQVAPGRAPSRAVGIAFGLSAAATVDVVVESPTGRRVKTVANQLAAAEGQNQVSWDGRDEDGRPVPAGSYRARVLVAAADGQRAVAERIVILGR